MYSSQIMKILNSNPLTSQLFQGCFPCDRPPPQITRLPSVLIINLDSQNSGGSHWIALIYTKGRKVIYFDSLALPISKCISNHFLKNFSVLKNVNPYQSPLAKTCSHHCISLVYFLSLNYSFPQYIKLLDSQPNPDLFVTKILYKLINR